MKVFISVVSHDHEELISELGCLAKLANEPNFTVVLKSNKPVSGDNFVKYLESNDIHFIDESHLLGFGENNNYVYDWCVEKLSLTDADYFLILNPDVYVNVIDIFELIKAMKSNGNQLSTLNLFRDNKFESYDYCVRTFPSLFDFIRSYIGLGNKSIIDKRNVNAPLEVDWAAGSFLLFKASLYNKLEGFDSNYFMYCEDIDICWRSITLFQEKPVFFPHIRAIHYAQHANRSIFSKHFFWHLKSMFRYLTMYYKLRSPLRKKENEKCTKE
mgnify:CR=1 FL=1